MQKQGLLYEGKAKRIYSTENNEEVWVEYKDSATAFNGEKKAEIGGKGVLNNEISSLLFSKLKNKGIGSHFIKRISENEQLVKRVDIIPLEVVVRNVAAGSLAKRLGLKEGTALRHSIVEFYYKDDELGDPLLTDAHIELLELASREEVEFLKIQALKVDAVLTEIFEEIGIKLIDFKLEFGKNSEGQIVLADEISPDTCRLWDMETDQKLDKDVFRRGLGSLTEVYSIILERLGGKEACTK